VSLVLATLNDFLSEREIEAAHPESPFNFTPINLDNLTEDSDDMKTMSDVFTKLAAYAKYRAYAMDASRQGKTKFFDRAARCAWDVYLTLPEWAKW